MSQDGRVSQYANLHVYTMHSKLCAKLDKQFGPHGPMLWVALILAGKREIPQGTFSYASEEEAWSKLVGYGITRPDWPIGEFFRYTGRLKETRDLNAKRSTDRRGTVRTIKINDFDAWQRPPGKPRGRGKNKPPTYPGDAPEMPPTYPGDAPGDAPDERQMPANVVNMQNARARGEETRRDGESTNVLSPVEFVSDATPVGASEKTSTRRGNEYGMNMAGSEVDHMLVLDYCYRCQEQRTLAELDEHAGLCSGCAEQEAAA